MGAGASFDPSPGEGMQHFYCHNCNRNFLRPSAENLTCPNCDSTFVEEVEQPFRRRGQYHLSEEQARRLSSAAALLQLLENQLREELSLLQANYDESEKKPKLTKLMRESLRNVFVDVEKIVSQPGCPVCSEDYVVGDHVTQLPCGHIYHDACVMPWLESKLTCPICRYELVNVVPPVSDLQELSQEELLKKIGERQEVDTSLQKMNREELGLHLHRLMEDELREHEAENRNNAQEQPTSPVFPSPSPNSAAAAAAASMIFATRREENPLQFVLARNSQHTHDVLMQQVHDANAEFEDSPSHLAASHRTAVRRYRARNVRRREAEEQREEDSNRSHRLNWLDVDEHQENSEETAASSGSNDTTSLSQDHNSIVNAAFHREPTQLLLRPSGMSATPQRTYVLQSIQNGSGVRLMQTSQAQVARSNMNADSNLLSSTSYRPRSLRQLMEEN